MSADFIFRLSQVNVLWLGAVLAELDFTTSFTYLAEMITNVCVILRSDGENLLSQFETTGRADCASLLEFSGNTVIIRRINDHDDVPLILGRGSQH